MSPLRGRHHPAGSFTIGPLLIMALLVAVTRGDAAQPPIAVLSAAVHVDGAPIQAITATIDAAILHSLTSHNGFRVVDRQVIDDILRERELAAALGEQPTDLRPMLAAGVILQPQVLAAKAEPAGAVVIVDAVSPDNGNLLGSVTLPLDHRHGDRVDAATGKATPASDGLPAGAVHDVKLNGDALWVAGGTEKDGFIACRTDAQPWRIWRAPARQGAVNRIAFDERWIIAIHDRARRFSRFDLESGAWQVIGDQRGIDLPSELLICNDGLVLRKAFGLAYNESALLVLRIHQHGGANAGRLRYPPDGRRSKAEQRWFLNDLIGARQHWDKQVHHLPLDAFVPLRRRPADAITHCGHIWILDGGGNLIATDDFARFAGPFSVADQGLLLQGDNRLLYVIDAQRVVSIPWAAIETQLKQPEVWRSSQEIYDHVRAALDQWLADLPDHDRAWYLWSIRRYDLRDTTPPAAANPPSTP